ncbi:MAG: hypothetical protein LBV17_10535 [Treponema sp.]|nr:hypothetical protein [Treponema sp.]
MPRQTRIADMKNNRGEVTYRKFTACAWSGINSGSRAVINRKNTISMLKAIIRYLNFKGNTPIIIHHYEKNHKINLPLRQRCNLSRGIE